MNSSSQNFQPNTLPPFNPHEISQPPPSPPTHSPHSASLQSKLRSLASNIDFKTDVTDTYSTLLSDYGHLEQTFSQNLNKLLSRLQKTISSLPPTPLPPHNSFKSDFSYPLTLFASFLKSKINQKKT